MTNTMKTITFIVSLFVFIFFFIIVNMIIPVQVLLELPNAAFTAAALYMAGYIVALYSQALIKYLYTRNRMKVEALSIISSFPAPAFEMRDRLLILALPFLAVLLPIVRQRSFTADSARSLLYLAVLALIIEVLYFLNKRTVKVYVGDKGIAVSGIDFRLELSVPLSYSNAIGYYPFEMIENFLALNDKVILYQTYDFGTITINCSEEEARQLKGLLVSKKIPVRRY